MKIVLIMMSLLVSLLLSISALAGGGGISGSPAKYITVQICGGESGEQCKMVQIKNRFTEQDQLNAINQKGDCLISIGEALMVPCTDDIKFEIPKWLQKLNDTFNSSGAGHAPNDIYVN